MFSSQLARRAFLGHSSQGLGAFALASMLGDSVAQAATPKQQDDRWTGAIEKLHFPQKAKRV
ncbi:MAG: sulfatase, partial [Rhodopirellula sp.]|nr:sulfatase [Rhodopirellula sp.]